MTISISLNYCIVRLEFLLNLVYSLHIISQVLDLFLEEGLIPFVLGL
jgi:hypothetical protein